MAGNTKTAKPGRNEGFLRFGVVFFVATVLLCLRALSDGRYEYRLIDGADIRSLTSYERSPAAAIEQAGLTLGYGDSYTVSQSGQLVTVEIQRSLCVKLVVDGEVSFVSTNGSCVRDVLAQVGIIYDDDDILSCTPGTLLEDGMTVELTRVTAVYSSCQVPTSCGVVYVENPAEADGVSGIIVQGRSGIDCVVYKDTYVGGVLTGRERCDSYTVIPAETRVVQIGTGEAAQPYIVTADGRIRALPDIELTQAETPVASADNANWGSEGDEGDPNHR